MRMIPVSSNITSTNISAAGPDYDCTEMPVGTWIWAAGSVLSGCVGFPASVWLLWVLLQRQRSGLTNDISILNLTAMDLIFSAFSVPVVLNDLIWGNDIFRKIDYFLYSLNITGRPLFMVSMCVDCFVAVVYPVTYMKMKRSRYRLFSSAAVWGITVAIGIISVFVGLMFLSFRAALYLLMVPTIVVCDLVILYSLRKPDPSGRTNVHPQKQRAMQTIIISLSMTVVCYLPLLVLPFLSFINVSDLVKRCSITIPMYIAPLLGSTILPLLQLHSLGKLRAMQAYTCASLSEQPAQQS